MAVPQLPTTVKDSRTQQCLDKLTRDIGSLITRVSGNEGAAVSSTVEELKIIRGIINTAGAGTIVKGGGFTIERKGTGDVLINFTAAFSDTPSVTAVVGETAGTNMTKHNAAPAAGSARLVIFNTAGVIIDGIFHFTAIGPR